MTAYRGGLAARPPVQQIAPSIQSAARSAHALESSNARVYSLDTKPAQLYPMNNFYALSLSDTFLICETPSCLPVNIKRCIISSHYFPNSIIPSSGRQAWQHRTRHCGGSSNMRKSHRLNCSFSKAFSANHTTSEQVNTFHRHKP